MKSINQLFTENEKNAVRQAVTDAERKTSGEIMPVVASSSGRYDRAEDIFGILTALTAVSLAWWFFQDIVFISDDWHVYPAINLNLAYILAAFAAGFIAGSSAATYFPSLKLPFLTNAEIDHEVERSAAAAFHRRHVRCTKGATGILIYISLFEHRVRVLPDDSIREKFGAQDWEKIRDMITEGMRAGRPAEGLCRAVTECGELLAGKFPIQPGDVNELSNDLQLID